MSVFQVQLNNVQQGLLDKDPSTATAVQIGNLGNEFNPYLGSQMNPSKQRTIFVAGPHRIYRELFDGQTFTDCNYWKRFAFPQVPLDQAFIKVVTDDGSIWSDVDEENTFPVAFGGASAYNVLTTDTFTTNFIDVLGTYGGPAVFTSIQNLGTSSSQDIKVQLNGSSNAVLTLAHGAQLIFDKGDMFITKLGFQGGSANTTVQVLLSVQSQPNT